MVKELTPEQCRRVCPELTLDCKSTDDLKPSKRIIGQDRAMKALQFGLRIRSKGFNVYIAGMPGTGRRSAAVEFIKELAKDMPVPPDWCYVYNFREPSKPNALSLPAGKGKEFTVTGSILREGKKVLVVRMELKNEEQSLIAVGIGSFIVG